MNQQKKPKLPLPKYIVLKKMKRNGKKYWPPRLLRGRLEYDTIQMPAVEAQVWNHVGCITNEEKFRKGMLVHPDSIKT